jgi:septal ring factor EnvC (AmiA/AmiB activator)
MSRRTKRGLVLALTVLAIGLTAHGCGSIGPLDVSLGGIRLGSGEGIEIGGAFAGSLGAGGLSNELVAATGGSDSEKWAAAIAVGSFVASEIVQREVERRRAEHERESRYLDSEIEVAEQSIRERESELDRIEKELARQERTVARLERQRRDDAAFRAEAEETLGELEALIQRLDAEREVAEAEIEIYTEAVRSSREQTDASVSEEELEARRRELTARRDERLRQYQLVVARGKEARALKKRIEELET